MIVLLAPVISCQEEISNYPQDAALSDLSGQPTDSFQYYFPGKILSDTGAIDSNMDTFKLKWYSTALFVFDEPILFNYYQGHDIYRFLYIRSFDPPLVISLHRNDEEVWLSVKKLDRSPRFIDYYQPDTTSYPPNDTSESLIAPRYTLIKADRKANIVLNEKKVLSENEWTKFDSLLTACQFRTLPPTKDQMGIDGSQWIIESHLKSGYYFVERRTPKDKFRDCGKYLLELSGLEEDVY